MLRLLLIALLALVPIGWAAPSFAQSAVPIVVSSCGTPIYPLTASQNANPTMDTTGKLCTGGTAIILGAATFTPAQVSVANTATLIAALRAGRRSITIVNTGTTAVYLGPTSGVTTSNGTLLPGILGASITLPYTGAVYGIAATGSETVTEHELY